VAVVILHVNKYEIST